VCCKSLETRSFTSSRFDVNENPRKPTLGLNREQYAVKSGAVLMTSATTNEKESLKVEAGGNLHSQ